MNLDTKLIRGDKTRALRSLIPTLDEKNIALDYRPVQGEIDEASAFILMLVAIPRYQKRIEFLDLNSTLDEDLEDVALKAEIVIKS